MGLSQQKVFTGQRLTTLGVWDPSVYPNLSEVVLLIAETIPLVDKLQSKHS